MKKLMVTTILVQLLIFIVDIMSAIKTHSLISAGCSGIALGVIMSELTAVFLMKSFYKETWEKVWR